jgi:hypothetical protein
VRQHRFAFVSCEVKALHRLALRKTIPGDLPLLVGQHISQPFEKRRIAIAELLQYRVA